MLRVANFPTCRAPEQTVGPFLFPKDFATVTEATYRQLVDDMPILRQHPRIKPEPYFQRFPEFSW
jgi:glucuronate isomerase